MIPLAIPLLLFDSNLVRVVTDTGSLLLAFIIGSFSTVISTLITWRFIPLSIPLGENGWKICSALAARHIGGAINFVSVCETLNVGDGSIVSAAIAADNVVVALYFAFLFYLAVPGEDKDEIDSQMIKKDKEEGERSDDDESVEITMQSLSVSITVASCIVALGKVLTGAVLPTGTSVSNSKKMLTTYIDDFMILSILLFSLFSNIKE